MPREHPVVLVTGTSTGIGRESVLHLQRAGCRVVATARNPARIADLSHAGEVECMELDVTSDAQRRTVVEEVLERHGRIDALVNNAGYGANLAVEETTPEIMQAMFSTNVFGPHELARLVLPHMRAQGSGRIINVASIAGHVPVPMLGAYCATKFALRALTHAMHNEVRSFGIHACLVEPGIIRTNFGAQSMAQKEAAIGAAGAQASPYAAMHATWAARRRRDGGAHPRVVAGAITHACTARRPRFHYFVPWDSKGANLLKRILPDAVLNQGYRWYFGS